MNITEYPELFIKRCGEASRNNGFGYDTQHRLINNNWVIMPNGEYTKYTGLCLGG